MSLQYAARLPIDSSGQPMQEFATPFPAIAINHSENNSVSSVITFNDNATVVEVNAIGGAAAIRWLGVGIGSVSGSASVVTAASGANFDHIIPSNYYRRFVIPRETAGVTSIVGANIKNGLYNRMAVKSVGIASVATTQY